MKCQSVNSTAIQIVGYENTKLRIVFKGGRAYDYYGVPESVFNLIRNSGSVGVAYNQYLKGGYASQKLEDKETLNFLTGFLAAYKGHLVEV